MVAALSQLGANALAHPSTQIFWSGVIGGWIIALAAWLVSGSHSITGSVMVISVPMVVLMGTFAYCGERFLIYQPRACPRIPG